jgi:hypothetical protein
MIEIPLTRGKVALIDDCDAHLAKHRWYALRSRQTFYAVRKVGKGERRALQILHREILGLTDPKTYADHVNGYGLDNRRANLRVASGSQNQANRGPSRTNAVGFKGVHRNGKKWQAAVRVATKSVYLGVFDTAEEAARAYDAAAVTAFGEYAWLNFPTAGTHRARDAREEEPPEAFNVGDRVAWGSQAGGVWRKKDGEVIEVVPPRRRPASTLWGAGPPRHELSYVVRAAAGRPRGRQIYWPRASVLRRLSPSPLDGKGSEVKP